MMYGWGYANSWWMFFWMIFCTAIIVGIVVLVVWALTSASQQTKSR